MELAQTIVELSSAENLVVIYRISNFLIESILENPHSIHINSIEHQVLKRHFLFLKQEIVRNIYQNPHKMEVLLMSDHEYGSNS